MSTDESSFTLDLKKNRLHIWWHHGGRLRKQFMVLTFKSGFQRVSVWGGFTVRGRTPLVGAIASFEQHTYRFIVDNHILTVVHDIHGGSE